MNDGLEKDDGGRRRCRRPWTRSGVSEGTEKDEHNTSSRHPLSLTQMDLGMPAYLARFTATLTL